MKTIEIKTRLGNVLFSFEKENNTLKDTIEEYIKQEIAKGKRYADLQYADFTNCDLRYIDFTNCDLVYADFTKANLENTEFINCDFVFARFQFSIFNFNVFEDCNLEYSYFEDNNLKNTYFKNCNLDNTNFKKSNIDNTNLMFCNLQKTKLDKRYIQVSCIGSLKRMTTYCFDDDIIYCGCFKGNLYEFEIKCKETHKNNEQYLKEYLGFINYLKAIK